MPDHSLDLIVVGSGGLAREFTSYFSSHLNIVGYSTNSNADPSILGLNGEILGPDLNVDLSPSRNLALAIASPKKKKLIYEELSSKGFCFPSICHPNSIVSSGVKLDDGVIISPFAVVGPNVSLGKCCYLNFQVGLGHDCCIGDYTHINPGVQVGGGSVVRGESLLGSNATLLQNTFLEKEVQIGAGAIVLGRKIKRGTISPLFSKYLPF